MHILMDLFLRFIKGAVTLYVKDLVTGVIQVS